MTFCPPEFLVTCGKAKGILHKERMKKGSLEKCIQMADGTWLTLREFEIEGGRELAKNWKMSIHCGHHTLKYLIQRNLLPSPPVKRRRRKKKLPAGETGIQLEAEKGTAPCKPPPAQQVRGRTHWSLSQLAVKKRQITSLANRPKYLAQLRTREWIPVACRAGTGRLYKNRFASVHKGKCIKTETQWCTPAEFLTTDNEINIDSWTFNIRSGGLSLQSLINNHILKLHTNSCTCLICSEKDAYPENNDDCFVCKDGGNLFCCDSCPKSFHRDCHIPTVPQENDAEWNCTFCIVRKNKEKGGPENSPRQQESKVLRQRMYPEQQIKCEFLLMRMYCYNESIFFTTDPCHIKMYYQLIREPMWLDQIKERLGDETYNRVQDFVMDMRLIFSNCREFNKDNQFGHLGAKLEAKFERDFKAVFDIKEVHKVTPELFP